MRYIGDTVLTTPLIQALDEGLPFARIDVGVNKGSEQVLFGHPMIGNCWRFPHDSNRKGVKSAVAFIRTIRQEKYDMVVDLTNNDRTALFTFFSGSPLRIGYRNNRYFRDRMVYTHALTPGLGKIHTVDHHLKVAEFLGLPVQDRHPSVPVLPESLGRIEKMLDEEGLGSNEPFVLMHPGARRSYKSWPLLRFARLADDISRTFGVQIILSGSRDDARTTASIQAHMETEALDWAGMIPLRDLPALIKKGLCLIGNDSAPIHIATAVQTPTISLFGPTRWEDWAPRRSSDRVLAAEYPCRPCGHSKSECFLGNDYCMNSISLEKAWAAVKDVLNSRKEETKLK